MEFSTAWKTIKGRTFSDIFHFKFAFDLASPTEEMWNSSKQIYFGHCWKQNYHFLFGKELFTNFIYYLAKLVLYSFGQTIEFFCDLTNELYSCLDLLYAANYAEQCSLCSCLIPTFSKFMYSSSSRGLDHSLGVRISLPLVGTFSDLKIIVDIKYIKVFYQSKFVAGIKILQYS